MPFEDRYAADTAKTNTNIRYRTGVVTAVQANRLTVEVNVDGQRCVLGKNQNHDPAVGEIVHCLIDNLFRGVVTGSAQATPAAAAPPAPPAASQPAPTAPAASVNGTYQFWPAATNTYRSDGWVNDGKLYQGDAYGYTSNQGFWFYGTQFEGAFAGNYTLNRVQIYVPRVRGSNPPASTNAPAPIHVGVHGYTFQPAGAAGISYEVVTPSLAVDQSAWVDIPVSEFVGIRGGIVRGFGITGNPYAVLAGINSNPNSGTVLIDFTRS